MAFKSKDGKRNFGNRQQAQAYDSRSGATAHKEDPATEERADGGNEDGNEPSEMDIHEHVAQHGPAEKVEISHSEGRHTKVSHHGGAKHVSHHESAEEAHQAGAAAAGIEHQEPDGDEYQPAMSGEAGAIPGM